MAFIKSLSSLLQLLLNLTILNRIKNLQLIHMKKFQINKVFEIDQYNIAIHFLNDKVTFVISIFIQEKSHMFIKSIFGR